MSLKEAIKAYAYTLGADLVGFGSIDRCAHAPLMMSPQGLLPGAQTVIVMGVHPPDACIELGGERHPQEIGPYTVQYLMNSRLDEMAYRLSTFIERHGYGVMPIASSNIWRYNSYKDLEAIFAPDVSHIYMAVVAGLADLGYSGLALTPEYGARNRFITVITDAVLEADPLIPPGTVCDRCLLCRAHCPSLALATEIDGDKVLQIGEYAYRFPNKNIWRCAWAEHFDLDLDLPIPKVVNEEVITRTVQTHGSRGGEMGQCLKYCVPKPVRTFDRAYSTTPLRKNWATIDETLEARAVTDRLLAGYHRRGAEHILVTTAAEMRQAGIDVEAILPGAVSAITVATVCPPTLEDPGVQAQALLHMDSICFDLARELDHLGFRSVMTCQRGEANPTEKLLATIPAFRGRRVIANTVVTRKTLAPQHRQPSGDPIRIDRRNAAADLTSHLLEYAKAIGADLAGVASVERLAEITAQLRPVFDGEEVLDATDRAIRFTPWAPEIHARPKRVTDAEAHLAGAQSVLVIGLRYHAEAVRWATRPPAEAVGPYAYQTYVTSWLGQYLAYQLVKRLEVLGYRAAITQDLTGTDSLIATPREQRLQDIFGNRFAAMAAGLGYLTTSGHLATPQFGLRQRCIAIVTDAPLTASPLYVPSTAEQRCATCDQACVTTCPTQAITSEAIALVCEGQTYTFRKIDAKRCDWSKRYALPGDSGFKYLGSPVDLPAPAEITPVALAEALRQHDAIKKARPVVAEPCVINCPYSRVDDVAEYRREGLEIPR